MSNDIGTQKESRPSKGERAVLESDLLDVLQELCRVTGRMEQLASDPLP